MPLSPAEPAALHQEYSGRGLHHEALEERFRAAVGKSAEIAVPQWGSCRLRPEAVEFWQGRRSRVHDRLRCTRQADSAWKTARLSQ